MNRELTIEYQSMLVESTYKFLDFNLTSVVNDLVDFEKEIRRKDLIINDSEFNLDNEVEFYIPTQDFFNPEKSLVEHLVGLDSPFEDLIFNLFKYDELVDNDIIDKAIDYKNYLLDDARRYVGERLLEEYKKLSKTT